MSKIWKVAAIQFDSGNSCDVVVDLDSIRPSALNHIVVAWDSLPPSAEDLRLLNERYLPIVNGRLKELTGKSLGTTLFINADAEDSLTNDGADDAPGLVN